MFLNATNPRDDQGLMRTAMVGVGFQGAAHRPTTCCGGLANAADRGRRRRPSGCRRSSEQVIHFVNKKMPGGLPKKTARALLDIEDKDYVPIIRDPKRHQRRDRGGVLFPRLRLRAAVLSGGAGDAGDAVACRRADGAAAGLPVLRLSAARLGPVRQGREDHHRQPGAVPSRGQHAELPRHQDRGGQLRHLLRPARRATSSRRSSPAAASSTSTNTCWRRASRSTRRPAGAATCITIPATPR